MYEARFQRNGQALALAAKLGTLGLSVIAYPLFSKVFHIMYIKAHHVSQSVRIEQSMCSLAYGIFGIAFHQSQVFQTLDHNTGRKVVHFHIRDARTKCLNRLQMHGILYLVNSTLAWCEGLVGRNGRRHITAIA